MICLHHNHHQHSALTSDSDSETQSWDFFLFHIFKVSDGSTTVQKNSYRVVKFTASSVINWKLNCLPTYIAQSSIRNVWVLKIPVEIIKVIQHASETICFDSFVQCKSLLASDMEIKLHTWSKCLRWNVSSAILIRTNNSKQCVRDWDTCCTLTIHVALFSIKVQIFALENKVTWNSQLVMFMTLAQIK